MLRRPEFHLDRLPLRFRWEVTRRHPVYIQIWEIWRTIQAAGEGLSWDDVRISPAFLNATAAIQVFGAPIDPAVGFDDLTADAGTRLFFRDALQPVSVKSIAGVLMRMISANGLRNLAQMLAHCADAKDRQIPPDQVLADVGEFLHSQDPELNATLDAPFYSLSPVAPREQLTSDLVAAQAEWRTRLDLPTSRDRSNDYPEYLEVWDRCEGFSEGQYHRRDVHSFSALASEWRQSASTIRNRYHRAFQRISGQAYSFDNWVALMGVQQLSSFFGDEVNPTSRRRFRRSPDETEIDFSTVTDRESSIEPRPAGHTDTTLNLHDTAYVIRQICQLIEHAVGDQEIVDRIEMNATQDILEAIAYLRIRDDLRTTILSDGEI